MNNSKRIDGGLMDASLLDAIGGVAPDIQDELALIAGTVHDLLTADDDAIGPAGELVEALRQHGSDLAMLAGAGDRYFDPAALMTIATVVVLRALENGTFRRAEDERSDESRREMPAPTHLGIGVD